MINYSIPEFYGIIVGFICFVFIFLIIPKGIYMIMAKFFDKQNVFFHHHFHYRDRSR